METPLTPGVGYCMGITEKHELLCVLLVECVAGVVILRRDYCAGSIIYLKERKHRPAIPLLRTLI